MTEKQKTFFAGKKIIVTGGAGFIGSHICEELVSLKADVFCLDNLSAGKRSNVSHLSCDHFHIIEKDICDRDNEMNKLFENCAIIFHNAASKKNICLNNPQKDLSVNAGGTLNLLQYAIENKVSKFVHASTGSVYGEPKIFPSTEDHPLAPVSYYGVSKLAGERYVDVFNKLHGLNTTILRYFHVYGPRQESNEFGGVVSIFLRKLLEGSNPIVFGDGEQVRSFTWVKDLVAVNLKSAMLPIANGKTYNAASGIQVTINELARKMIDIVDPARKLSVVHGPPLVGDILQFDVSNDLVKDELKITFNVDFWKTLELALKDSKSFLGNI